MAKLESRQNIFFNLVKNKFGDQWEILSEYFSSRQTMIFKCKFCKTIIKQTPKSFLRKSNCQKCYFNSKFSNTKEFVIKANLLHNNKFDYSKVEYKTSKTKVLIICKEHNLEFWQEPRHHLEGHGCEKCWHSKLYNLNYNLSSREEFIQISQSIHHNSYNYDNVIYLNNNTKVEIICLKCNKSFYQIPRSHTNGHGCSNCSGGSISNIEQKWLKYINVPEKYWQKSLIINNKKYRVDAYDPITKTIYEFYGDFWHGNPDKFNKDKINGYNKISYGELYNKTIAREKEYINADYNVISLWENDFLKTIGGWSKLSKI